MEEETKEKTSPWCVVEGRQTRTPRGEGAGKAEDKDVNHNM